MKEFYIYVDNNKIEVSPEIYYAYWRSKRHERHLSDYWKDKSISLDYLVDQQILQAEYSIVTQIESSTEEEANKNILI